MMKRSTKGIFATALVFSPLWIIGGIISGYALSTVLTDMSGMAGFLVFIIGALLPLLALVFALKKIVHKSENRGREVRGELLDSKMDYYYVHGNSGIAVDVSGNRIRIIRKDSQTIEIDTRKIRSVKAYKPGTVEHTTFDSFGMRNHSLDTMRDTSSQLGAAEKTGLYFELDDVFNPSIHLRMHYPDAERWILIFNKLAEGSLEKQASAMFYPRDSAYIQPGW